MTKVFAIVVLSSVLSIGLAAASANAMNLGVKGGNAGNPGGGAPSGGAPSANPTNEHSTAGLSGDDACSVQQMDRKLTAGRVIWIKKCPVM